MLEPIKYGNQKDDSYIKEAFKTVRSDWVFACRNGYVAGEGDYIMFRLGQENTKRKRLGLDYLDPRQVNDFIYRKVA